MTSEIPSESWEHIKTLVELAKAAELEAYLHTLPAAEVARAISRLSQEDQTRLITLLTPEQAADIIEEVEDVQAVDIIEDLEPKDAAAIIDEMHSDAQADLIGDLDEEDAEAILDAMTPEEADDVRQLLQYPPDTAGGVMITEYLAFVDTLLVSDVLDDLHHHSGTYSEYDVQYAYVVTDMGILVGVLRMRQLLLAPRDRKITDLMLSDPFHVSANAPVEELDDFFDKHSFLGVPVTDDAGRLVGIAGREDVEEAITKISDKVYLESSGIVGGEELRSMPLLKRATRRLSWLSVNVVLNIAAASVIAFYQDTLEKAIMLAVFLPIISDMSGCSGNQAVAVSIRELTLGLVRPREILRVFFKESLVGLINGAVLGLLLGGVAMLWKGNPYLGLVVGSALAANTVLAVSLGGLIPLVLKGMKVDPALASSPMLTTITDMCGFFLVLSLAEAMLPRLIG